MGKIGIPELLIILVLVLVIFGGSRLAGVGKALGGSIKDFKNELGGKKGSNADTESSPLQAVTPDTEESNK